MTAQQHVQGLVKACLGDPRHPPHRLLWWLSGDVLADLGIRHSDPPPAEIRPWLHDTAAAYARAVSDAPFADILGALYQELASRGQRRALGQFFTPEAVCTLTAAIVTSGDEHAGPRPEGGLWRACEPACGSGALILGLMAQLSRQHGAQALQHWSITAIDVDPLCARLCAAQVLANLFVHRHQLGELVVYEGNALGPTEGLRVVVHLTVADLAPDFVLPALHPSRIAALRDAARMASGQADEGSASVPASASATEPAAAPPALAIRRIPRARPAESKADESQVDLFAD